MAPRTIDIATLIDGRKLGGFNYRLIMLSWLITVFDGFDMMMVSFTAPYMRDELGLDKLMLGNVFASGLVGMMVGGFLFSNLGDRIGRRWTIILAAYAFGLLTTATALAQDYPTLLALRFLDGLAIGGMLPLAWALNIEYAPSRMRSSVVTVIMVGYSVGTSMAGPITVWLAPHYGWEGVFVFGGVATLICATLLLFGLPESVRFLASKNMRPAAIAGLLNRLDPSLKAEAGDRFILSDERQDIGDFTVRKLFAGDLRWLTPLLWLGYVASTLAIYFKSSWGPIVLEDLRFPRDTAAYLASAGGALGAVLGLLLMRVTDRKGPLAVAFYPLLAAPVLLVIGLVPLSPQVFLAAWVFSSSFVGGAHFGILSLAGVFYPSAIRANGAGWATSIAKIGGISAPVIGGYVLSSDLPILRSFAVMAACPAILVACAVGVALIVKRREIQPERAPKALVAS